MITGFYWPEEDDWALFENGRRICCERQHVVQPDTRVTDFPLPKFQRPDEALFVLRNADRVFECYHTVTGMVCEPGTKRAMASMLKRHIKRDT